MKALSIKEPWASLILRGEKTIETRTWQTKHRGDVLICASKKPSQGFAGHAVCIAKIVNCRPMTKEDEHFAKCDFYHGAFAWELEDVREVEHTFVQGKQGLFDVPNFCIHEKGMVSPGVKDDEL